MKGKVYGDTETYVVEHVDKPGVILGMLVIGVYDEGRTYTTRSARIRKVLSRYNLPTELHWYIHAPDRSSATPGWCE